MHLFCTYMGLQLHGDDWFTERHYIPLSGRPRTVQTAEIKIQQSQKRPPHYKLLVRDRGGDKAPDLPWEIEHGQNNVFHCLVLFAHYVRSRMDGHLGHLDLASDAVALLQAVSA
eukprot:c57006_g1_i1.p4 GENE.c57006_g1_i1~~c57006_g1_i1.p4  ORF type:complete len:114 (+),score=11.59 c57006_g1_i1:2-343(+)